MRKKIPPFGIVVIIIIILTLFLISTILIRKELLVGESEYQNYVKQFELLNRIRSSIAYLSMWQMTYIAEEDDREKYLSHRRMGKITGHLPSIVDSLKSSSLVDSINISRLQISINQLIEAHQQIITKDTRSINTLLLDSMQIDYRSVFDIVNFHIGTVQDLLIREENKRSKNRYFGIILLLIVEIIIIIIIVFIVYLTLNARKKAEKKLLEAEGYFNDVVNSMPSVLIGTDDNGKILRINRMALKLCSGYDWIDKSIEETFPQLMMCSKELKESIKSGKEFLLKEKYVDSNNETFIYYIKSFPFLLQIEKEQLLGLMILPNRKI